MGHTALSHRLDHNLPQQRRGVIGPGKSCQTCKGPLIVLPVKFAEVCTAIVSLLGSDVLIAGPRWEGGGGGVTGVLITRLLSEKGLKKFYLQHYLETTVLNAVAFIIQFEKI